MQMGLSAHTGEGPRISFCVKGEDPRTSNIFRPRLVKVGEDPSTSGFFSFSLVLLTGMLRAMSASHMLHCSAVLAVKLSSFLSFLVYKGRGPKNLGIGSLLPHAP